MKAVTGRTIAYAAVQVMSFLFHLLLVEYSIL